MKQHVFLIALLLVALLACEKDENKLPTEPVLLLPANGSVVDLSKLGFDFSEGSDPENAYVRNFLKVSEDSVTWYEVKTYANSFECELEFKEGQKYYWKVQCFEYDESANQVIAGRMTESNVFHFYTNAPNVFDLKAESSSHTNWTGRNFVKLTWLEPDNTDYVEVTFEPQVTGIKQPIEVPAGTCELLIEDFFNNWVVLKKEEAKVYSFAVKAYNADGLAAVPDTIKAVPLDKHLVNDADLNVYGTVMINNQVWLDVNLMTTRYNDGTPINKYYFKKGENKEVYGHYYDSVVLTKEGKNPCPCGFHLPTLEEWRTLERFIGIYDNGPSTYDPKDIPYGTKEMKILFSKTDWLPGSNGENNNGSDLHGFNLKPAGIDNTSIGEMSKLMINENGSYIMRMFSPDGIWKGSAPDGSSIRCIRDN
ncbi:FISUMP domain-containing protein [Carboxylicivirga taeanensis]|uniref:FISUMP domain-containing protein n=1 Tax=Carboxylicivirga taeanensis TaxID=1416875 RepID=UPI003F6E26A6